MISPCLLLLFSFGFQNVERPPAVKPPEAAEVFRSIDPYWDRLFQLCCMRMKVNSDDCTAACHLLSSEARHDRKWVLVLEELRGSNGRNRQCLQVLGKFAAVDAAARDILAMTPEKRNRVASMPGIALYDGVVPELIPLAESAELNFDGSLCHRPDTGKRRTRQTVSDARAAG